MSNIRIIEGVEHWDLAAEEVVAEAPIDGAPVRRHFRPYAVGAAKTLLKAIAQKYTVIAGQVTEWLGGDPSAYAAFFNAHFLKMSEVVDSEGKELSLEDQLGWLADNPQIKAEVINALFLPLPEKPFSHPSSPVGWRLGR